MNGRGIDAYRGLCHSNLDECDFASYVSNCLVGHIGRIQMDRRDTEFRDGRVANEPSRIGPPFVLRRLVRFCCLK